MSLPERSEEAEQAFVASWASEEDPEALAEVITVALDARRPRLAARLFGLLDERVEIEPGTALDRARTASRLLLHDSPDPSAWVEMEDAWAEVRRRRMERIRRRMRGALRGDQLTVPRVGRKPRRR